MFKKILMAVLIVGALAYVGHQDYQDELMREASATCEHLDATTMPTFDQCIANQLERNGDK